MPTCNWNIAEEVHESWNHAGFAKREIHECGHIAVIEVEVSQPCFYTVHLCGRHFEQHKLEGKQHQIETWHPIEQEMMSLGDLTADAIADWSDRTVGAITREIGCKCPFGKCICDSPIDNYEIV